MRVLGPSSTRPRTVLGPSDEYRADAPSALDAVEHGDPHPGEASRGAVRPAEPRASSVLSLLQRAAPAVAAVLIGASVVLGAGATPAQGAPARAEATAVRSIATHGFEVRVARDTGAYYRKVVSEERSSVRGLTAVAILPRIDFDPDRHFVAEEGLDYYKTGPLDRPSVYLGGHGHGRELDAGLTWDRVYDAEGRATYTDRAERTDGRDPARRFAVAWDAGGPVLADGAGAVVARGEEAVRARLATLHPNFAFRVYWRTTNDGGNQWNQPGTRQPDNAYFYPGERVRLTLRAVRADQVKLEIGRVGHGYAFSRELRQQGFGRGAMSVKRVASIDQFGVRDGVREGRERQPVLPTRTTVRDGGWESAHVLGARGARTPMTGRRFIEVRGADTVEAYAQLFRTHGLTSAGAERLDITPFAPSTPPEP
jgi:hypothetical protein